MIALTDVEIGKGTSTGRILPLFGTFDPLRRGQTKRRERGGAFNQPRTPPSPSFCSSLRLSFRQNSTRIYLHIFPSLSVLRGYHYGVHFHHSGGEMAVISAIAWSPSLFLLWLLGGGAGRGGWIPCGFLFFPTHFWSLSGVGPGLGQPLSCHEGTDSFDCSGSAGPNPCAPIVAVVDLIEDCRSFGCSFAVDRTDLSSFCSCSLV